MQPIINPSTPSSKIMKAYEWHICLHQLHKKQKIPTFLYFICKLGWPDFCRPNQSKKVKNQKLKFLKTCSKGFEQKVATLRLKTQLKIKENSIGNFTTSWAALLMKPHLVLDFCTKSENFIHRTFVLNQKILVIGPLY